MACLMDKAGMSGEWALEVRKAFAVWWRWSKQLCKSFRSFSQEERRGKDGSCFNNMGKRVKDFLKSTVLPRGCDFGRKIPVFGLCSCCCWWGYWGLFINGFLSSWARWVWELMALRSGAWPVLICAHPEWKTLPAVVAWLCSGWQSLIYWRGSVISWAVSPAGSSQVDTTPNGKPSCGIDHCMLQGMWGLIQHLKNLSALFFLCWAHLVCAHPALKIFSAAS